jgi:cell division protein FtsI (penicillin-binding protein 3)
MQIVSKYAACITVAAICLGYSICADATPARDSAVTLGAQDLGRITVQNYSTEATISPVVNSLLQKEVMAGVERYRAKGGLAVILNAKTGEIVAAVTANQGLSTATNRLTTNIENSAALRLMNFAMAIENGWMNESTQINVGKGLRIGGHEFMQDKHQRHVYGPIKSTITATEAFTASSIIAGGQIGEINGPINQQKFLAMMGQLTPIQTGGVTTARPQYPQPWRTDNAIAIGFGRGFASSPLHALGAVASLVNGGSLVTPTFTKPLSYTQHRRVISAATSERLCNLLKTNVESGSAKAAQIPGLPIGALTATNEKILGGHYLPGQILASFVAAFPINAPQYVMMLQFDEPKSDSDSIGDASFRANAALTGALIIKEIAPLLGIQLGKS